MTKIRKNETQSIANSRGEITEKMLAMEHGKVIILILSIQRSNIYIMCILKRIS